MALTLKTVRSWVTLKNTINTLLATTGAGGTLAACSVIGRSEATEGESAAIPAETAHHVLRRDGSDVLGFGTLAAGSLASDSVTTDKILAANVTTVKLGPEVRGAHQALSGAGAVNLTTPVTRYTSTGASQALTLADGTVVGQRKRIIHVVDGGSGVLTAGGSLHLGDSLASITIANLWDWVELEWQTVGGWHLVGWAGAGVTFA